MQKLVLNAIGALFFTIILAASARAQVEFKTDSPVEYSNYIVTEQEKIGQEFLDFSNVLLNGTDVKANEAKRLEVVKQIELALRRLRNMAPFKDGVQLRNEAVAVFEAYRDLHVNDYARIAVLVSNKESSLEALEEYFQMQVKAEKKMMDYAVRLRNAQAKFAETYKLTLLHNDMQDQFDRILEANVYTREVFLDYIAVAKVNEKWWDAMSAQNLEDMKKQRIALLDAVKLSKIGSRDGFHGDNSFRDAAKARIDYFSSLASNEYKEVNEILENPKRTKEDIDFINGLVDTYNTQNQKLNDTFNNTHRDLKLKSLPAQSGGK
jgi:hypothetical protein